MEKINIQGVPETMIQTLYARARESKKKNPKIYDEKSIEIVSKLDYDFSTAEQDALMSNGVIARTILLDRMVQDFVRQHPHATIINIACGMDTRFYRVDNGTIRWYNLDLPETIAVRERFLKENGRVTMVAKSAMDASWAQKIDKPQGAVLVVMEGLVMYLTEQDVQQIFTIIGQNFSDVTVVMETISPFALKHVKEKSIEASKAKFTWALRSVQDVKSIAPKFHFVKEVSLAEGMKEMYPIYRVLGRISFIKNISSRLVVLYKKN